MIAFRIKLFVYNLIAGYLYHPAFRERFPRLGIFHDSFRLLSFNGIDGDYVEFGCFGCNTFGMAHKEISRRSLHCKLWAYDSFQGLPATEEEKDKHPRWFQGEMRTSENEFRKLCKIQHIPSAAYCIVPGFFQDTVARMPKNAEPRNIALAYIDSDLYSSAKIVLDFLEPRLKNGMIIAFDDYFCNSADTISGERLAFMEFTKLNRGWNFLPYKQFGWGGMSFIVEDAHLLP